METTIKTGSSIGLKVATVVAMMAMGATALILTPNLIGGRAGRLVVPLPDFVPVDLRYDRATSLLKYTLRNAGGGSVPVLLSGVTSTLGLTTIDIKNSNGTTFRETLNIFYPNIPAGSSQIFYVSVRRPSGNVFPVSGTVVEDVGNIVREINENNNRLEVKL